MKLKRYLKIFKELFWSQYSLMINYRAEIFLWTLASMLPFLMLCIWSQSGAKEIINYSDNDLERYFLGTFIVRQFSIIWVVKAFEVDLLKGKLASLIIQPIHPMWRYFSTHIAEQLARLPLVIGIIFTFFIIRPSSFWIPSIKVFLLTLITTWFAFLIGFFLHGIISALCFWTEKATALERLVGGPFLFLSGLIAPIDAFPPIMQKITYLTPFPYMISLPARILTGLESNILNSIIIEILWITLFYIIFRFTWKFGKKNYTAMGA